MEFTIIKNSESNTGYEIPDIEFLGVVPGLAMGWQFEVVNKTDSRYEIGKVDYFSVTYGFQLPEEYVEKDFYTEYVHGFGWEFTGRVIFRGYFEEQWDCDEHEWFYEDVTEEQVKVMLEYMKEE